MPTNRIEKMVQAVLLRDWDPIGVAGIPEATDEYDRYAASIAGMISAGSSITELANYLVEIEVGAMDLIADPDRALSSPPSFGTSNSSAP